MSVELGFWIPILKRIPDSLNCIPDSRFYKQNFPDSGFHKQKFLGFRNPDSLTRGEKLNTSTAASHRRPSLGRFSAGEGRIHLGNLQFNKEEKSLRHVAMVTEFLDDNKPKKSLKIVPDFNSLLSFRFDVFVKCWLN